MNENTKVVEFKNVFFRYERQSEPALKGVSLDIRSGEFIGIIGRSGAGKSTLCKCFPGLIPHFEDGTFKGDVFINGENTRDRSVGELSQTVGMVFQNPESQLYGLTVEEEISFALENHGIPVDEITRRIGWALDAMGLDVPLSKSPYDLSGGQKQRLVIASTMALFPSIIVLDEPTAELDPQGKNSIYEVLIGLNKKGTTVVMVDQDIERLVEVAESIFVIDSGEIIAVATPRKLLEDSYLVLKDRGIRTPQVVDVFRTINKTNKQVMPITLDEVEQMIQDKRIITHE